MIVIPDIHGRSFWKEAVKQRKFNEEIVFLGDYLDPYPGEVDAYTGKAITQESALENFKEIIDFKKTNDNVHLLIGNHDCEYFLPYCYPCRSDHNHHDEITQLFLDNIKEFRFGWFTEYASKMFLFTHAGISNEFISYFNSEKGNEGNFISPTEICDFLNVLLMCGDYDDLGTFLGMIGPARGGRAKCGSPVWADLSEMHDYDGDIYQVFGHTQMNPYYLKQIEDEKPSFFIEDNFAMLDCRTAFRLYYFEGEKVDFLPITNVSNARYVED